MVIQKQPFRERVEVPNFEANVYRLNTSATGPLDNLQEILPVYCYRGVACKYFGESTGLEPASSTWWDFGEFPKFEDVALTPWPQGHTAVYGNFDLHVLLPWGSL